MVRYGIAIAVAVLIIAGGVLFVRHTVAWLRNIEIAEGSGRLPPERENADLEEFDVGVELTAGDRLKVLVSEVIVRYWFVLVPMVLGACLGIAALIGRGH